ncbi:YifB family Mg chelatase-like AAA ATPase [Candidatus Tisiphia endosymbiont of Oplodontha viridula]|uniref:YifB family Mg chelatase-like AAA ATPase n=1 Tax=Candidatus Tisiphia endosymbiont of Oplodontha viridula TaxID=3077925 RepID=UPI0035C93DC1
MIVHLGSLTFSGIDIIDVDVQVQISPGIPNFTIVGLADKTIGESKERVRAALSSIGLALPAKKILINLAPADLVKEGSHFDLAIACAILSSMKILPAEEMQEYLVIGELSLDGSILPVSGALPAAIGAAARNKGLICSKQNGQEAAWSSNNNILVAGNLIELVNHFKGSQILSPPELEIDTSIINYPNFKEIKGQKTAKRALEIAASGGHNLLMFGPPGTGKSMLAQCIPGILPKMRPEEILECSTIASVAGKLANGRLSRVRPFRAPHHSCSIAAMVGGGVGKRVKPGEISLAHNGVLFLDELPEFPPNVIESLRQPIETGEILIARSNSHIKYPANFQLIAAMNPCKCGYLSDPHKACSKAPKCGSDYQMRISGPIMDRFDLHINVGSIDSYNYSLMGDDTEEGSEQIANRVEIARNIQQTRYEGYNIKTNNRLDGHLLIEYALPVDDGKDLLNEAATKFRISMRAYNRILRVARTIADLEGSRNVYKIHIAEALNYRKMDNNL